MRSEQDARWGLSQIWSGEMWPLKGLAYCKSGTGVDEAIREVLEDERVSSLRLDQLKVLIAKLSTKPTGLIKTAVILACSKQHNVADQI